MLFVIVVAKSQACERLVVKDWERNAGKPQSAVETRSDAVPSRCCSTILNSTTGSMLGRLYFYIANSRQPIYNQMRLYHMLLDISARCFFNRK